MLSSSHWHLVCSGDDLDIVIREWPDLSHVGGSLERSEGALTSKVSNLVNCGMYCTWSNSEFDFWSNSMPDRYPYWVSESNISGVNLVSVMSLSCCSG